MRSHSYIALILAAVTAGAGCGDLNNAQFRVGKVRGTIVDGAAPAAADVWVLARPELAARADPTSGTFEIADVPAGKQSLYVHAADGGVGRVDFELRGGDLAEVGAVALGAGAWLDVEVRGPDRDVPVAGARVTVVGTPVVDFPAESTDHIYVGPVAPGCYTLRATAPGFAPLEQEGCTGPTYVEFEFGDDDNSDDSPLTSVECTSNANCAPGLSCNVTTNECVGSLPACAACTEDDECGTTGRCLDLDGTGKTCVYPCVAGGCEDGLTCDGAACVPQPRHYQGCGALARVGSGCASSAECRAAGLIDGVCVDGSCSVPCADNSECPDGTRCEPRAGGMFCAVR